jgi:hypothetical protein
MNLRILRRNNLYFPQFRILWVFWKDSTYSGSTSQKDATDFLNMQVSWKRMKKEKPVVILRYKL